MVDGLQAIAMVLVLAQGTFQGSVPAGQATAETLPLSLQDAVDRGLTHNLGLLESDQATRVAHAERLRRLNALLPDVSANVSGTREQINLKALGFNTNVPGLNLPSIVGPFGVADARVYLSQSIFNWSDIQGVKAAAEDERASQLTYRSDRDLVVFAASNAYLVVLADGATVESTRAQVTAARALHDRAVDQNASGLIASISVLRARVELQTQQQRLIAAENQFAIDKLALARVIGLPKSQAFRLTDATPFAPLDGITLEQALERAYVTRPDFLSAQAQVRAAELTRQSAAAELYPSLSVDADYGVIGSPNFGTSHGTFSAAITLTVPIFQGTRVRAKTLQADAALTQRKAELEDLDGRIDEQIRTAFLNLTSSSSLVAVARSNVDLAGQTLTQAHDRFSAGVADNLEVVQAQESVAAANQSHIASLYAYNLAKISLARAMGVAEQSALTYLGVK